MTTITTNENPSTISEKAAWLETRYWRFGLEEDLEDQLFDLFETEDNGQMTSQPRIDPLNGESAGLMVLGRSGDGKTALLKRTLRKSPVLHELKEDLEGNTLFITVPPEATIKKLAELILAKTGYHKIDAKSRSADAWEMVMHRLALVGVKAIVIDECHHIFFRGAGRDVPGAIQSLKHILQSAGGIALIVAGVPSLRDDILSETSRESSRRFDEFFLSDILLGTKRAALFARNFYKSADVLGIEVEQQDAIAERVLFARNGQVGRSIELGKRLLRDAVTRRNDVLTLERADAVFRRAGGDLDMTPFHSEAWSVVQKELEAIGWGQ